MAKDILTPSGGDALKALAAGRAALLPALDAPPSPGGLRFERAFSLLLDTYFQTRLAETGATRHKMALVALGGYGRGELCLGSDIDVIILCRRSIPPQVIDMAQPLFLPLWDAGYSLGHGFRTLADCVKLAAKDPKLLCSLLDARVVAGDAVIFDELCERIREKVLQRREKTFLHWLDAEHSERSVACGPRAMVQETNIKEGLGGLRDYHRLLWLARLRAGFGEPVAILRQTGLSDLERTRLENNVAFLHDVRNRLHALAGSKNDRLTVALQPVVAQRMGFADANGYLGVERFLGELYHRMDDIRALSDAFRPVAPEMRAPSHDKSLKDPLCDGRDGEVLRCGAMVHVCPAHALLDRPQLALAALKAAALKVDGTAEPTLAWRTRQSLVQLCSLTPDLLTHLPDIYATLVAVLHSGHAATILGQAMDTGLLGALVPDVGASRDSVQFDGFHTHPVGRHTLLAISFLEGLGKADPQPTLTPLWKSLPDRTALMLAALFHDVGKGVTNAADHATTGTEMVRARLATWGVADDITEEVAFLVEHHPLLASTSHRLDLSDESVVAQCASVVGTQERLNHLFLLSYADSRATGPKAWTRWSAALLEELYTKVGNLLRNTPLATPSSARTVRDTCDKVRMVLSAADSPLSAEDGETMLGYLPTRYALSISPEDIVRHMVVVRNLEREIAEAERRLSEERAARGIVLLDPRPLDGRQGDRWELVAVARDQHGLFATISGVLALHSLSVFSADAFVWRNDTVVDIFHVSAPPDPANAKDFWTNVRGAIQYALTGKLSLDYRIDQIRANATPADSRHALGQTAHTAVAVTVDNGLSDFYTVIDVRVPDRPALLYDVARTLQSMRLDILFAKIATLGATTNDSFSVRNIYGQKVTDDEQLTEIRSALLHVLQGKYI